MKQRIGGNSSLLWKLNFSEPCLITKVKRDIAWNDFAVEVFCRKQLVTGHNDSLLVVCESIIQQIIYICKEQSKKEAIKSLSIEDFLLERR